MSAAAFPTELKAEQDSLLGLDVEELGSDSISLNDASEWKTWSAPSKHQPFISSPRLWTSARKHIRFPEDYIRFPTMTGKVPKRIILLIIVIIAMLIWLVHSHTAFAFGTTTQVKPFAAGAWVKPEGIKIIGFMFYGRRNTVEVLECYLRKNLVSNGGFLDEVHFVVNTDNTGDLDYLLDIVSEVDGFKKIARDDAMARTNAFEQIWPMSMTRDAMMVKIDDDLVWMDNNAVPEIVTTLINHPEAFSVLGNLVNSAALGWLHHHRGAIHSYLPERELPPHPSSSSYGPQAWRMSALPTWQPGADGKITEFTYAEKGSEKEYAPIGSIGGAPYPNHRWLPLRDNDSDIYKTPIADTEYDPFSQDWKQWSIAAQQHYSFFENLEKNQLEKYTVGGDGTWNLRYMRGNINLIAFWANDVLDNIPFEGSQDDEHQLTITMPQRTHNECLIQTRALASHFSFFCQPELIDTDLLSRYRAVANEMVCTADNQIPVREPAIM